MKVAVKGFGSIGRRHVLNLLTLGIKPYVVTKYPDYKMKGVFWVSLRDLKANKDIRYAIISSCTARHLEDLKKLTTVGIRNFLIEKPMERDLKRASEILRFSAEKRLKIYVAYNMRYLKSIHMITDFIRDNISSIRLVEVVAGQYLPEWRPSRDYRDSYSACRSKGGGVDLDLSHEIDYVLHLFGKRFKKKIVYRDKISDLKINSPDIFKLFLVYKKFVVDMTLDYIRRPKERCLKVFCENGKTLYYDFVKGLLKINGKTILNNDRMSDTYIRMLEEFLGIKKPKRKILCSAGESLNVLRILEI